MPEVLCQPIFCLCIQSYDDVMPTAVELWQPVYTHKVMSTELVEEKEGKSLSQGSLVRNVYEQDLLTPQSRMADWTGRKLCDEGEGESSFYTPLQKVSLYLRQKYADTLITRKHKKGWHFNPKRTSYLGYTWTNLRCIGVPK